MDLLELKSYQEEYERLRGDKTLAWEKLKSATVEAVRDLHGASIGSLIVDPKGDVYEVANFSLFYWEPSVETKPKAIGWLRLKGGKISKKVYRNVEEWEPYYE